MKKKILYKISFFIIAFIVMFLQPCCGFLTARATMPSPDWMPKYIPVPDNETIMKAVYQVRNDAYTAAFANNGKLAQNVDATAMAAALEFAYEAAGLVAQTGTYKDEYKAKIQYIKDTSVLPDGLKGLDANIYFATLDYADMTIGYYMNEAGEKVGKGYVKFKEKSADVIKAMLDAIKNTNYWSKPFKFIDGNTYTDKICLGGSGTFIGYLHDGSQQIAIYTNIDAPGAYCFMTVRVFIFVLIIPI